MQDQDRDDRQEQARNVQRRIDEAEGVDAEALHHAQRARDRAVGHRPHQHVGDLGHQRRKVPKGVVRRRGAEEAGAVFIKVSRLDGTAEAVETPVGLVPTPGAIDTTGLDMTQEQVARYMNVSRAKVIRLLAAARATSMTDQLTGLLTRPAIQLSQKSFNLFSCRKS